MTFPLWSLLALGGAVLVSFLILGWLLLTARDDITWDGGDDE